jgi:hypothetical protein
MVNEQVIRGVGNFAMHPNTAPVCAVFFYNLMSRGIPGVFTTISAPLKLIQFFEIIGVNDNKLKTGKRYDANVPAEEPAIIGLNEPDDEPLDEIRNLE